MAKFNDLTLEEKNIISSVIEFNNKKRGRRKTILF